MDTHLGYSTMYEEALRLAAIAHQDQVRKTGATHYITHPIHVSVILLRHGFPIEVAVGGLLHDVVEDQGIPLTEVEARFGPQVAEIVQALTERKRDAEGNRRLWERRKQESVDQLGRASLEAVAVKVADTLHNIRSIAHDLKQGGPDLWRAFRRGPEAQLRYYHQVLRVARERLGDHPIVNELADAIVDLAQQTGAGA
jgi:(p)ppGpp synthase/HD superfamily hydrolase